jgi:hypothetical protein
MRHFYRSHTPPADVLVAADAFFADLGFTLVTTTARTRTYTGPLGALRISARAEGGHYTFVEATSDQMGESQMDRNVKRFFVQLHRAEDPTHTLNASY